MNVVGQASGLEKYECVSLDLLMRLFSMVSRKAMCMVVYGGDCMWRVATYCFNVFVGEE